MQMVMGAVLVHALHAALVMNDGNYKLNRTDGSA
jgi:hypothetical protein